MHDFNGLDVLSVWGCDQSLNSGIVPEFDETSLERWFDCSRFCIVLSTYWAGEAVAGAASNAFPSFVEVDGNRQRKGMEPSLLELGENIRHKWL
jgi:hypothetical protein